MRYIYSLFIPLVILTLVISSCGKVESGSNNDSDNDGIENSADNCPNASNPNQADSDGDGVGDACDSDVDGDGVGDSDDNCPSASNPDQADSDGDGTGDVCDGADDTDSDGDGAIDSADNCPTASNADQADSNSDGVGNACTPIRTGIDDTLFATVFPDPNLRACLSSYAGANGWTYATDATGSFDACKIKGVSNIIGMENLTGLTGLDLSRNSISDVSPLRTLVHLKLLNVRANGVTTGVDTLAGVSWAMPPSSTLSGYWEFSGNSGMPCAHLTALRTAITGIGGILFLPSTSTPGRDCS